MVLSPRAHFIYIFKQEVAQQTSYKNAGFKLEVMAYIIIIVLRHDTRHLFSYSFGSIQRLSLSIYLLYFTCSEMAKVLDIFSSTFLFNSQESGIISEFLPCVFQVWESHGNRYNLKSN